MADSAPGYGRRPDEPQCYNCGLMGHWAVGCPEPTRSTPAGLEAWRNTSHSGARSGDNRGGQKKQKGPIITRYAPPAPAPDYSNHSSPYPGWSQYAQPNPTPPPPPPPAQSSRHSYHQPPPPPQQPPGHYSHYPTQPYPQPPGYYQGTGFLPPPPGSHDYGSRPPPPHHDYRSHSGRQQPPGPPPPYPPSYHAYPPDPPPGMPPIPPPPTPPASARPHDTPPRPPPSRRPPGLPSSSLSPPRPRIDHRSSQKDHSPANSSNRRTSSGSSLSRPSIGMAKADMIAHGLPPKPPPSKVDQADMRRDNRNKKGQNKQQGNRENNTGRDNQSSRRQQKKQNRKNRQREKNQSQTQAHRQESVLTDRQGSLSRSESLLEGKDNDHHVAETDTGTAASHKSLVEKSHDPDTDVLPVAVAEIVETKEEEERTADLWEQEAIFNEVEATHPPDEVGKPLPAVYTEDILLPRKWDAKCVESAFFDADSLENFIEPIHESKYWDILQYDPAFSYNGALPSGDPLSIVLKELRESQNAEQQRLLEQECASPRQQPAEDELSSQDRDSKRKRSAESSPDDKGDHRRKAVEAVNTLPQPNPNLNRRVASPRPGSAQHDSPLRRVSPPLSRERRRSSDRNRFRDGFDSPERRRSRSPERGRRSPDFHRSRTPIRRRRSTDFRRGGSPDPRRRHSEARRSASPGRRRQSRSQSRYSSVSPPPSRSSSLDSLERELLGISSPDKGGQQTNEGGKAHNDAERAIKPKRRRAQVDSAYSRRW